MKIRKLFPALPGGRFRRRHAAGQKNLIKKTVMKERERGKRMFRKILPVLTAVCSLFCILFSCGSTAADPLPPFDLTEKELCRMSNYMGFGCGTSSGEWYYGDVYSDGKWQGLGKLNLADLSGRAVLAEGVQASWISEEKGWLYYFRWNEKIKKHEIRRITVNGDNETVFVSPEDGEILSVFIHGDRAYYAENIQPKDGPNTGKLYSVSLDGSDRTLILDKPVFFPYIAGGKLLYQDDLDRCRLHICNPDGGNDRVLVDDIVFQYVTSGDTVYYQTVRNEAKASFDSYGKLVYPEEEQYIVKACNIVSGATEKVIEDAAGVWGIHDGIIYYLNIGDSGRLYAFDTRDGSRAAVIQDEYVTPRVFTEYGLLAWDYDRDYQKVEGVYLINYKDHGKTVLFR